MAITMDLLLQIMMKRGASDLLVHSHTPPQIRLHSKMTALDFPVLSPQDSKSIIYSQLTDEEIKNFEERKELDKGYGFVDDDLSARFRMNVFYHRGAVCAAIRSVPTKIPSFEELGLPDEQMSAICRHRSGLVLITGATGAGKTTTLAALINRLNNECHCHIVTVEDPIEVVHKNINCVISQRQVGEDTHTFGDALKYVLRQDPDVILIGEMRDLETIQAALNIAETGHLVFASLHTSDCVQTINRIIDVFPSSQQPQVRTQLSYVLLATLSQQLMPNTAGDGRCLAYEIMLENFAIKAMIREEKVHQIFSSIQTGGKDGMRTMNQSLYELYKQGKITYQEASAHVTDNDDFKRFFKGGQ
ncbi:MAG: type IV pilus twitching motility protein PilT [Candidatus Omnitrophica bacterium]|nr:type IV pilus twitching motility protein PilT [Candidatus Omnitrophota bacterium]